MRKKNINKKTLFHVYFLDWIDMYKRGVVSKYTLQKYIMTHKRLAEIAPDVTLDDLDRRTYQWIISEYGKTHEKQTVGDFHTHLRASIRDAFDEGIIGRDPSRRVVITGREPSKKKEKWLSQQELQRLMYSLDLTHGVNQDWIIFLIAKTGLRYAEALGVTPADFDFEKRKLTINKTWNYKAEEGGFIPTKNASSKRIIEIDPRTAEAFSRLVIGMEPNEPVLVTGRMFNATSNDHLKSLCEKVGITVISIHSLRHTHASLLIFAGVSMLSISKRLGHSNLTTMLNVYSHIVDEMENRDSDKAMSYLMAIG